MDFAAFALINRSFLLCYRQWSVATEITWNQEAVIPQDLLHPDYTFFFGLFKICWCSR